MQICEWIFFGEGDLQLNGLMIKVIAVFFLFFFLPLPSSTAEHDGMWEGEGRLGTKRLKSTKPFWLLKIFLASLIAPVAEKLSIALREKLPSDVALRQRFSSKPPLFVSWKSDKEQERSKLTEGAERLCFSQALGR